MRKTKQNKLLQRRCYKYMGQEIKLINHFKAKEENFPRHTLIKEPGEAGIYLFKNGKPSHLIGVLKEKDCEKIHNFPSNFILNLNKLFQICLDNKKDTSELLKLFTGNRESFYI